MLDFQAHIGRLAEDDLICLQPRMGFASMEAMTAGLHKVARLNPASICTITLDSFTRVGDFARADRAILDGSGLNGFPIVSHDLAQVRQMIDDVVGQYGKPVQVRHGSPKPEKIFRRLVDAGVTATEGGPISYCLPYGKVSIVETVNAWRASCAIFTEAGPSAHIESFAGCMLGQLCDPSLLIALNILEGMFFRASGITSMSFSYAQGTSMVQDVAALRALNALVDTYLPDVRSHIVIYMFMGIFPSTLSGAAGLINECVQLAKIARAARIIVKTPVESERIPTLEENLASIDYSYYCSRFPDRAPVLMDEQETVRIQKDAQAIIESVLNAGPDLFTAIPRAFELGILDVPFCIHPNNAGQTGVGIDERGYLCWMKTGNLQLHSAPRPSGGGKAGSRALMKSLFYIRNKYDGRARGSRV